MIALHRITHPTQPVYLNPDLVLSVEASPDTTVTLTTGAKFIVSEDVNEVLARIREWRASILVTALSSPEIPSRREGTRQLGKLVQLPVERS